MTEYLTFVTAWRLPFILHSNSNWCSEEGTLNLKIVDERQSSVNFNTQSGILWPSTIVGKFITG
jgi:hypothetical protein